jgi:hypothetical protein
MVTIDEPSLSRAWARALVHVLDHPGTEISPLVLSFTGFKPGEPMEDAAIRGRLDRALSDAGFATVQTIANTIFPASLWKLAGGNRTRLIELYREVLPRIKGVDPRRNGRGLYFERLTMYGRGPYEGNQLEFILRSHKKGTRRSKYQASIFDPERDHINAAQMGFPCLQHLTFAPLSGSSLAVNAFYATQQLFDKAYGNYLGIARLGSFMAQEMSLTLKRVTCFVGVAKLERIGKRNPTTIELGSLARTILEPVASR